MQSLIQYVLRIHPHCAAKLFEIEILLECNCALSKGSLHLNSAKTISICLQVIQWNYGH